MRPAYEPPRPYWGPLDAFWGIIWVLIISAALTSLVAQFSAGDDLSDGGVVEATAFVTFLLLAGQQLAQLSWPFILSSRKGLGLVTDWMFRIKPSVDIGFGVILAVACLFGAYGASEITSRLVGLENPDDASNTHILTDHSDSVWLAGIIFLVVVGAPITEELLFRGLMFRTIQSRLGTWAGVLISTLLFTLPHFRPNSTLDEALVLYSGIFTVGIVLSLGAIFVERLGPAIVAHSMFNIVGTWGALA